MLEEDCDEVCEEVILNQCYDQCSCLASKRLTDVLAIARKQHECLKKLYARYKYLQEYIEEIQDNGNIPDEDEATSRKNYRRHSMGDVSSVPQFNVMVGTKDSGKQLSEFDKPVAESDLDTTNHSTEEENSMISRMDQTDDGPVDSQNSIVKEVTHIARLSKVGNFEKTVTDLPLEILQHIYKFLGFNDLCNVQQVCLKLNEATKDIVIWKTAPLKLECKNSLEKVGNVPYLHSVTGYFDDINKLFHSLANNVIDLRKMNCSFWDVSLELFQNFLDKFENLEFILLCTSCPNFLELLEAVSIHTSIISLSLYIDYDDESGEVVQVVQVVRDICRIMHSGFVALRKLSIRCDYKIPLDDALADEMSELCMAKLNQLTDFAFLNYDVSKALKFVIESPKLESLEISADEDYIAEPIDLNLNSMKALKFLTLNVKSIYYETLIFPPNIEHLKLQSICTPKIIGKAVDSLPPSLRVLHIQECSDSNLDQQLENIHHFSSLHTVIIAYCGGLSVVGVETILMKCAGLRKFEVVSSYKKPISFRDETYECLKNCKYLGDLKFAYCILNPYKLVITISAMKRLTNVYIVNCTFRKEDSSLASVTEDIINSIITECKFEKPYAKIDYEDTYGVSFSSYNWNYNFSNC